MSIGTFRVLLRCSLKLRLSGSKWIERCEVPSLGFDSNILRLLLLGESYRVGRFDCDRSDAVGGGYDPLLRGRTLM